MVVAVFALIVATLFAGAALYISLVEHPARLRLDDVAMIAQWQPSYTAALPIQSGLAVLGGILGIVAWVHTHDLRWLAGSAVLLANWPFTIVGIMPTNKRLMAMSAAEASVESRTLLQRWGQLHNVRSALGTAAAAIFAWIIVTA